MPFRGNLGGEIVPPATVPDQQPVDCPECGETMYPREGGGRARHFYHAAEDASENCSKALGESNTHARCTALAVAALNEQFGDQAARCGVEIVIETPSTPTEPDYRRADAVLEFDSSHAYYGRGIIIEVQYKNLRKDIQGTTYDYLQAGYSVAWITPEDFADDHLDLAIIDKAFEARTGDGYSVRDSDPWDFDPRVEAEMRWDVPEHDDPIGDGHDWVRVPAYAHPDGYEYQACHCGARRRYDHQRGQYVYDHDGILAPSESSIEILSPTDNGTVRQTEEDLETGLMFKVSVAPCRGPKGVHEWGDKAEYEYTTAWTCKHCPVRLVRDAQEMFSLVGNPEADVRYQVNGEHGTETDSSWYCLRCEELVEKTETGECQQCDAIALARSILPSVPANWKPGTKFRPGVFGYIHEYLDVSVGLHPPTDGVDAQPDQSEDETDDPKPHSFTARVKWPNHIPHNWKWIVPAHRITTEEEAKAWLSDLLITMDAQYDSEDLTSLGEAFGDEVAEATRDSPVVTDDLDCEICGAYLPHYRGSTVKQWYENHRQYMDNETHPVPKKTGPAGPYDEFYGSCPHCDEGMNSPQSLLDHLQEHGYTRSDAHGVMQRIG